jgi:hypothetical protein
MSLLPFARDGSWIAQNGELKQSTKMKKLRIKENTS